MADGRPTHEVTSVRATLNPRNPGPSACAFVLYTSTRTPELQKSRFVGYLGSFSGGGLIF